MNTDGRLLNNLLKEANMKAAKEGLTGEPLRRAQAVLKELTPEFDAARAAKAAAWEERVKPFDRGLAGDLRRMGGGVKEDRFTASSRAINITFPKDVAQPKEIRQLIDDIGLDAVDSIFKEHFTKTMQNAFKGSVGDTLGNANKPAKFVEEFLGTDAQRKNVAAFLDRLAGSEGSNPRLVKQGFYKLMKALDSYRDVKLAGRLDTVNTEQKAGATLASRLLAPASRFSRFVELRTSEKAYKELAELVMSKDGLDGLEKLAKSVGTGYTGVYLNSLFTAANRKAEEAPFEGNGNEMSQMQEMK